MPIFKLKNIKPDVHMFFGLELMYTVNTKNFFKMPIYTGLCMHIYLYIHTHLGTLNCKILRSFLVKEPYFTIRNKSAGMLTELLFLSSYSRADSTSQAS